jgi:murein DD-endopeptidase MepM/ murein hydrolase activator NlpD
VDIELRQAVYGFALPFGAFYSSISLSPETENWPHARAFGEFMNLTTARLPRACLVIFLLILLAPLPACGIIRRIAGPPMAPREIPSPPPPEAPASTQPPPGSSSTSPDGDSIKLIIPVEGVRPDDLRDTFSEARSEGREHNAIDIMAPKGTPVLAAADGEIVRIYTNRRGGNTIYQLSADRTLVFYYAHLDRYADGLSVGHQARQGEVIGYVGDTGNARGTPHLHFEVHPGGGAAVNPTPYVRNAGC